MGRVAGTVYVKVDGEIFDAKGNFTCNLGKPKREGVVGADRVHGYKEMPQLPFVEGEITDRSNLNLETLMAMSNVTVTVEFANGKVFVLREAWYAADGDIGSEEGNVQFRFEGKSAEEVR